MLQPDIKYYVNDPGMSAVWALVPAVQAAIKTGVVDPKRVGLHGHSWGGYQTAFTITQTDIFAAAIAGAPLTNMISMYSIIYKNTGGTNGAIFESSQGRFTGGPWEQWAAYTRNSPVAHAKNVKTPLIILHNDLDGAVDFTQGIEYFNTLRRLGKPVVLLEYPGENHGLARPANQQDYTVRMKEFFDHYLKGAPAPEWLRVRRAAAEDAGAHRPAPEGTSGQGEGQGRRAGGRRLARRWTVTNGPVGHIDSGRVILGGLVAGIVANVLDFASGMLFMADDMSLNAQRLGIDPAIGAATSTMVTWVFIDFIYGILIVFTYAAMRPRFGPGPKTAIIAGLTLFATVTIFFMGLLALGFFMQAGFLKSVVFTLISNVLASLAGCAIYKEQT